MIQFVETLEKYFDDQMYVVFNVNDLEKLICKTQNPSPELFLFNLIMKTIGTGLPINKKIQIKNRFTPDINYFDWLYNITFADYNKQYVYIKLPINRKDYSLNYIYNSLKLYYTTFMRRLKSYIKQNSLRDFEYLMIMTINNEGKPEFNFIIDNTKITFDIIYKYWRDSFNLLLCNNKKDIEIKYIMPNDLDNVKNEIATKLINYMNDVNTIKFYVPDIETKDKLISKLNKLRNVTIQQFRSYCNKLSNVNDCNFKVFSANNINDFTEFDKDTVIGISRLSAAYIWHTKTRLYLNSHNIFAKFEI